MKRRHMAAVVVMLGVAAAAEPSRPVNRCEDPISARATVDPQLDVPFFKTRETAWQWWIVEDESGHLEDTIDGVIDADDLLRVESAADCVSTHQGEHRMRDCVAMATSDGVVLEFSGGMPAYASKLVVTIDRKLGYRCAFSGSYPAPTNPLKWKITGKELHLKSAELRAGSRILGWISVAFEEIDETARVTKTYKISGHFKPVLQHRSP